MNKYLEDIVDGGMTEFFFAHKIKSAMAFSIVGGYAVNYASDFLNLGISADMTHDYLIVRGVMLSYEYLICGHSKYKNLIPLVFGAASLAISKDSDYISNFSGGFMIGDIVMEAFNNMPEKKDNNNRLEKIINFISNKSLLVGSVVTFAELIRGIPNEYNNLDNSIYWLIHSAAWGGLTAIPIMLVSIFSPHNIKNYLKSIAAALSINLNKSKRLYKEIIEDSNSNREKAFTLLKLGDVYFYNVVRTSDEDYKKELFSLALNSYHSAFKLIMDEHINFFVGMPPLMEYGYARSVVLSVVNDMPRKARRDIKKLKKKSNDACVMIFSGLMYESLGDIAASEDEYRNGVREILNCGKYKFRNILSTNNPVMVVDDPFLGGVILIKSFGNENEALNEFNRSKFVYYSVKDDLEVQFPISTLKIDDKYACIYRMVDGVDLITKSKTGVLPAELISKSLDAIIIYMDKCSNNLVNSADFGVKQNDRSYFLELKKAISRIGIKECKDIDDGIKLITGRLDSQETRFTHGDYHPGNTILINDGSIGIIDQERSDIGPVQDACASFLTSSYLGVRSDLSEFVSEHYKHITENGIRISQENFMNGMYFCSLKYVLKKLGVATMRLGGDNPLSIIENNIHRSHYLWMFHSLFDNSRSSIVSVNDVKKTINVNEYDILRRFGDKISEVNPIS